MENLEKYQKMFETHIDGETVHLHTDHPTGSALLEKVGKRPCGYEIIAEFHHRENQVIEPGETVDLKQHELKGFITAHKEVVTIFINDAAHSIDRGNRSVTEILSKVDKSPEGYNLYIDKDGSLKPLKDDQVLKIHGCEVFFWQAKSGGSS